MKFSKEFTIVLLCMFAQQAWSQTCDFQIRVFSDSLPVVTNLIKKTEFDAVGPSEPLVKFTPKSEAELTAMYPKIFKLKDSCYSFPALINRKIGIRTPELKACKYVNLEKDYANYEFKGIYSGHALIETAYFEGWGFLSIDLKTGLTCNTMGTPLTSDGKMALSYSNYYGDEEIALTDLETKKQYVIAIGDWQTIAYKIVRETYYLKLESGAFTDCKKELKYLKLHLKR